MTVEEQIDAYIAGLPEPKRDDVLTVHSLLVEAAPGCRLWFLDGRNANGKVVSNPNIGYGVRTIRNAGGGTREFYGVGLSATSTGVSVYVIGLEDKSYLARTYGAALGRATVTGYCIKFRRLADVDLTVLTAAMLEGLGPSEG
jgi:hypothetical protein